MALSDNLVRLYDSVMKVSKDIENKYKRHLRKQDIKDALEINDCVAKLNVCENEFVKTIWVQCRAVREAREGGFNETEQKKIVINSAVGYLLVKEARFAISTIRSYDSLNIAYDLLENAAFTIQGKKDSAKNSLAKRLKNRPGYDYIYSPDAYDEKCKIVEEIFEELIRTGDIENCLKRRNSGSQNAANGNVPSDGDQGEKVTFEYDEDKFRDAAASLNDMDIPEPNLDNVDLSGLGINIGRF